MMCRFVIANGVATCQVCGAVVATRQTDPARIRRNCRPRGLGDVIALVAASIGVKPCKRCKQRQAKLNAMLPLG